MNEELQQLIYEQVRKKIPPPNPIITKIIENDVQLDKKQSNLLIRQVKQEEILDIDLTLNNMYSEQKLIFIRWKNNKNNRNHVTYFASIFFNKFQKQALDYQGQVKNSNIIFNANYQSANLFAVYRINDSQYDLIMQNDINSTGYTQWFNYLACNQSFKGTVKFNLVNFYKGFSLFKVGMKPLCKGIRDKNWKRSAYNIEYYESEILMEGKDKTYYKILSFKYDFIYQNDTVQFCYHMPYTYEIMTNFIKEVNSPKFRVKYIGLSPMKNIINMLQISSSEEKDERYMKKAIIILGRQHSGEVPGSYIIQYMIEQLLAYTQENEFLLSRYNFYIFPMINVDGVAIGNYRCNIYGYDLNRCWNLDQPKKLPQLFCVKNQIKKIMKRQSIELILDIHGHSSKMNSFFYGNTFGKNNLLYPYIVSKIQPFVDFSSCNFTDDINQKSKTARVILGNLIKQTGSVYTYQVSLHGYIKNNKKFPFTIDNYQEIAKSLIQGMYKVEIQFNKEQRFLKESVFLKEIKKELKRMQAKVTNKNDEGSDDEAKIITEIEQEVKQSKNIDNYPNVTVGKMKQMKFQSQVREISTQTFFLFIEEEFKLSKPIQLNNLTKVKPLKSINQKLKDTFFKFDSAQLSRKLQLMNKLRINGQTFIQQENQLTYSKDNAPLLNASAQTQLSLKILKSKLKSLSKNYNDEEGHMHRRLPMNLDLLGTFGAFNSRSIRQPASKMKKLSKSNSTRVQPSSLNFTDLIKFNKFN